MSILAQSEQEEPKESEAPAAALLKDMLVQIKGA